MLPACIALQTTPYHLLGLAHQDVHVTNVAVERTTERTILYDNSLVAKMGDCAEMCDYCLDEIIDTMLDSPPTTSGRFSPTERDVYKMDRLILMCSFRIIQKNSQREKLLLCRLASQLVDLLKSLMDGDE